MSVVNRMLQDIDRRLGAATVDAHIPHPEIRSVNVVAPREQATSTWAFVGIGGAVVIAGVVVFYGLLDRSAAPSTTVGASPIAAASTPAASSPTLLPQVAPTAPVGVPAPLAIEAEAPPAPPRLAAIPPIRMSDPAPRPERAKAVSAPSMLESFKLSMSLAAAPATAAKPPQPPALVPAKAAVKIDTPVRQVAAEEMVEAARMLWSEGSHGGAIATLREALAAAEGARNATAMAILAREAARLEIAASNAQAALEVLRRHEQLFVGDAEALALRGNAEQRLGLHAEAAQSYLAALKLRPVEGKWMLGAAISLAANGRRDEAQGWVEKARDRGALTPTLAAYLEQLGVTVRGDARARNLSPR